MQSFSKNKIIPPEVLLNGYRNGIFPMSESREDVSVGWYSARQRGIIPLEEFKVSSNVKRIIRQGRYSFKIDTCFRKVMEECADRESTWISDIIINSYEILHLTGHAHSVEIFDEEENLVGGSYGVTLGAAFFGESMFKKATEADKVSLWHTHQILEKNGFLLWDTQFYTDHLAQFGCIEISSEEYKSRLDQALQKEAVFIKS